MTPDPYCAFCGDECAQLTTWLRVANFLDPPGWEHRTYCSHACEVDGERQLADHPELYGVDPR